MAEQICNQFEPTSNISSATICKWCGQEKFLHTHKVCYMAQQTDDLGIWTPTTITFIVNGKKYEGYPAPMSLFAMSLELSRLSRL